MKEKKICNICKMEIIKEDEYCKLEQFKKEKSMSIGYYHIKCFREKFFQQQRVGSLLEKTEAILNKFQM